MHVVKAKNMSVHDNSLARYNIHSKEGLLVRIEVGFKPRKSSFVVYRLEHRAQLLELLFDMLLYYYISCILRWIDTVQKDKR